jgi:hypothetical protein
MLTNSKTAPTEPQAATSSNVVTDLRSRDSFMMAISDACLPDKVSKIATRLALHFNCRTRQCNPGYDLLMYKLGISESTLLRGLRDLEAAGWIIRKRGGRDENVEFTLCIPASIPVTKVTPMTNGSYPSDLASIPVKNGLHTRHHADSSR